MAMNYC